MKKLLCLSLAVCMVLSLAACSNSTTSSAASTAAPSASQKETTAPTSGTTAPTESAAAPTEPEAPVEKIFKVIVGSEGTTLNPLTSNSTESPTVNFYHGRLYSSYYNEDGTTTYRPVYASGDPVKVDADGYVWNIPVREAFFSDGKTPINAETWEYTFKMSLDPVLANRAGENIDTRILNAAALYKKQQVDGKDVTWDMVGIKALDKTTLQITYSVPIPKPESVAEKWTSYTKSPVDPTLYEALMSADRTSTQYGTSVEKTLFSGPMIEVEWVQSSKHVMVKNPYFPLADEINLTGVEVFEVTNVATRTEMYEANQAYYAPINAEVGTTYMDSPDFFGAYARYILQIEINDQSAFYEVVDKNTGEVRKVTDYKDQMAKPILANQNFKKALWYAVDRVTLAKLECGYPANFVIPITSYTNEDKVVRYRDTDIAKSYTEDINDSFNPTLAKECFEKALKEEGLDNLELEILIGADNAEYTIASTFLQEQFNKIFDGKLVLNIRELPSKTRLSTIKGWRTDVNSYDIALALWSQGEEDTNPAAMFKVYSSSYWANCNAPYSCETVETLIWAKDLDPRWGVDEEFDLDLAQKMEKAHLESYQTIPLFERYNQYLLKEGIIPNHEDPDKWSLWQFDMDPELLK